MSNNVQYQITLYVLIGSDDYDSVVNPCRLTIHFITAYHVFNIIIIG